MSRSGDLWRLAHILFWTVLTGAFICVSAPRIFRDATRFSNKSPGNPYYSSDKFQREDGGSKRLVALFESLPPTGLIVIFVRQGDSNSEFLGMVTANLAWPHPVQIIDATQFAWSKGSAVAGLHSAAAVAFCAINLPPAWPRGERIGDTIQLLPIKRIAKR